MVPLCEGCTPMKIRSWCGLPSASAPMLSMASLALSTSWCSVVAWVGGCCPLMSAHGLVWIITCHALSWVVAMASAWPGWGCVGRACWGRCVPFLRAFAYVLVQSVLGGG